MGTKTLFFKFQAFLLWLSLVLFLPTTVNAEYIFTAPPREDAESGKKIYGPLVEKLSEILGTQVVYHQATGWFDYANKMRSGYYDIIFDGPHFAAWRVKNLKHKPIVELPGTLEFYLIGNKSDESLTKLRNLAGKKVCGMLSPHLGTSLVLDYFTNPVVQPSIIEIEGGMKQVYQAFKKGVCRAAILRNAAYNRLPKDAKADLKILLRTRALPNQTITISKRLHNNADEIATFMTSKEGAVAAKNLLSRYSKKAKYFEKTDKNKYAGIENLLEGVVYGW